MSLRTQIPVAGCGETQPATPLRARAVWKKLISSSCKARRKGFLRSLLAAAALLSSSSALAQDEQRERTESPYFFVDGGPEGVEAFPLESTKVSANVSGVIADVLVEQTYRNGGTLPIHARYVFPASTRAAVHGMQITVGNQRVVAKIKQREVAAAEFEKAKTAGKTASLLEQDRPNVFSMAVANIMPGDHVVVQLRYSELLAPTDGVYEFVYPTVVGPRYTNQTASPKPAGEHFVSVPYMHAGDTPATKFSIEVKLSTGVPIADLGSHTHALDIQWSGKNLARVALAKGQRFGGDRDFILDYRLTGAEVQQGLLLSQGPDENQFLLMVQPPARVRPEQIPPREYVFVLDVSGSMDGFPLETAKGLLEDLVQHMRPTDLFNLVLFAGDQRVLSERSLPANKANVALALALISGQRGGGGTELEAALRTAIGLPRDPNMSRSVVVITDGYISQERGAFELVAKNLETTNLFAFGIGSSVNRFLIEGLSRVGKGEPFVVTSPASAPEIAQRFRRYIESPLLTHVQVRFHGFDAYDIEPTTQPELFAERPIVVIGKWRGPRQGTIEVLGQTTTGPFTRSIALADVAPRAEHAALSQLWARTRIARLWDFDVDGNDAATTREITELGLHYSLLTQYTSFIAVLEQIRNRDGGAADVDQPLPLPLGVSELAVGGAYGEGDEPELVWLLALSLAGAAFVAWRKRARLARSAL